MLSTCLLHTLLPTLNTYDLALDPMTLIYKLDLDIQKMYTKTMLVFCDYK